MIRGCGRISFTVSTEVGPRVLLAHAARAIVEFGNGAGGKAVYLVFGDADLDSAVEGRHGGQACATVVRRARRRIGSSLTSQSPMTSRPGWAKAMSTLTSGPAWDPVY